jgi:hypothetical protein
MGRDAGGNDHKVLRLKQEEPLMNSCNKQPLLHVYLTEIFSLERYT